ncbi:hypothetical protein K438DRAFT_1836259, partial [Mycena galopus ATCC 62051]
VAALLLLPSGRSALPLLMLCYSFWHFLTGTVVNWHRRRLLLRPSNVYNHGRATN